MARRKMLDDLMEGAAAHLEKRLRVEPEDGDVVEQGLKVYASATVEQIDKTVAGLALIRSRKVGR